MGLKDTITLADDEGVGVASLHDGPNDGASPSTLSSPIQEFYAGTKILITGATGFLGKALAEKLLRSCHNIDTIYYLVRTKRGMAIEERHEKLLISSVFEVLRKEKPELMKKLVPIEGDVSEPELGLSSSDRQMIIQNIDVVFHSAATVRFNENIQTAFNLNTLATVKILELCKAIKNLKALVHVSTAYSNSDKKDIKEEVYPSPAEMEKVLEICKIQEEKQQEINTKILLGKHPNTYTLTKAMAESVVNEHAKDIPLCIVRPSIGYYVFIPNIAYYFPKLSLKDLPLCIVQPFIVCGAMSEPVPGWVDNFSSISGIMVEIGRGTLRSIICEETYRADVIPVDIVVNTLIAAGWRTSLNRRTDKAIVYNCTSSTQNPISWHRYGRLTEKYSIKYPSRYIMFYPGFKFRTNRVIHWFMTILFQIIPALILDAYLLCSMKKTYVSRLIFKFIDACKTGSFFTINEWNWDIDNMINLQKALSQDSSDEKNFSVDVNKIKWERYIEDYVVGLRCYALRDPLITLSAAKRKQVRIWWVTIAFSAFLVGATTYALYYYLAQLLI